MAAPNSRNVLVTGGSSGIGRAAVAGFARAGDSVWFTYRSGRDRAEALCKELAGEGYDHVAAFPLAQGDWASHEALFAALPGPVDVLVNNAAVGSATVDGLGELAPHERAAAFFTVNCVGPLWLAERVVPDMAARGYGKVVNVGSVGGGVATFPSFHVADGMSKAAVAYMSRHLAAQLVHEPVDVFGVCPGAVDTPMFRSSTLDHLDPAARAATEAALPKGRLIEPDEVAGVIWWLCGDDARSLHGAVIDGSMGLGVHPGLLTAGGPGGPGPGGHRGVAGEVG